MLFYRAAVDLSRSTLNYVAAEPVLGGGQRCAQTRPVGIVSQTVIALVLVVSMIGSFQIFDTVAVVYGGKAPIPETRVIYHYIYQQAFTYFHMGYTAAVAMVLVVILGVLTAVQMRMLRASRSDLG